MKFKHLARLIISAVLISPLLSNAAIDPNLYGVPPEVQLVAISPSGKFLAYQKLDEKNNQITVMSLAERKILYSIGIGDITPLNLRFVDDETVYLQAYSVQFKANISTGFAINLQTKTSHRVLQPGDDVVMQSGLGRIIGLSGDRKYAYIPAYSGPTNYGSGGITDNASNAVTLNILKVELAKTGSVKTMQKGRLNTRDYFIDENGSVLAAEEYGDKRDKHVILAYKNDKPTPIFTETALLRTKSFLGITADKKSLGFIAPDEASRRWGFYTLSLENGAITGPLMSKPDIEIASVITDFNRTIKGVVYDGFYPKYEFIDPAMNKRFAELAAKFPEQSVNLTSYSDDFKSFIIYVEGPNFAGDYFLSTEGKEPVFLVSARPKIPADAINPIGKATLTARDNLKIPTLLTIPRALVANMKNLPAIVLPHGGPEAHDNIGFDWLAQAFANQGYLVIQPQFRGSDGFGLEHSRAGKGQWGKKMQDDVTDALNALVKKGMVDPKRVCIVGASYGGYAALAGAAFTPDLYRCAVSINGVADVKKMLRLDMLKFGSDSEIATYWNAQIGKDEISNSELDAISPINSADKISAPVLLIVSSKDITVDPGQTYAMKRAINEKKTPVQLVELDGDDHYLSKYATRKKTMDTSLQFVNKYLK